MMWTPRDDDERSAVVELCRTIYNEFYRVRKSDGLISFANIAERIVPPVPTPEPEYNTYKGIRYNGNYWMRGCDSFSTAASVITSDPNAELTDDDFLPLMDLKANPVKVATPNPWYTHDIIKTGDADSHRSIEDSNGEVVLSYCRRCKGGEIELYTPCDVRLAANTPATVASEPVGFMNVYHEDGDKTFYGSLHSARKNSDYSVAETAVPLYRHPATEAEALAVLSDEQLVQALVARGAQRERDVRILVGTPYGFTYKHAGPALILPTTGAAHE